MIEQFTKLSKTLDDKIAPLVDAIEKESPTSDVYKKLLDNIEATLILSGNINRTLVSVANKAKEMEEKKDESNN